MATKIFKKILGLLLAFCFGVVAFGVFYALQISRAQTVPMGTNFYFLVSTDSKVEVSVEFTKLNGGAGYLLETEKERYVALSVYRNEADGLSVQEGLEDTLPTALVYRGIASLYFKGGKKKTSALYVNALRLLESYMSVLEECIARLEKGATQESCKRILALLGKQFAFAKKEYAAYPTFSEACGRWAEDLAEMQQGTLYLKELRYLLCGQVESYLEFCAEFSI